MNDHLVLICGSSGTGKTASLRNIPNPEGVAYLNCDAGKKLPFASKFVQFKVTDPLQIFDIFNSLNPTHPDYDTQTSKIHTVVIDTITFMMEMYESRHVLTAKDTMQAWGKYQQFFKELMQVHVAESRVNVIMIAHTLDVYNEGDMITETKVPVKGALKNNGLEAYFSTVVSTRKMDLNRLTDYENDMLVITEEEKELGFKHVFQTKITRDTVHHRIRSSMGMWTPKETFIDNDANIVMDKLHQYYV